MHANQRAADMSDTDVSRPELLDPTETLRFVSLEEAVRLSGLSRDSLLRHHRDKVRRISPRRLAMRLGDVLSLGKPA
jgi:hypothetical protein